MGGGDEGFFIYDAIASYWSNKLRPSGQKEVFVPFLLSHQHGILGINVRSTHSCQKSGAARKHFRSYVQPITMSSSVYSQFWDNNKLL